MRPTSCTYKYIYVISVPSYTLQQETAIFGVKGKAVLLHDWSGPEGSTKLRFPDCRTAAQEGGQPYALAAFTPRKLSWYSFLLEAESTSGP